MTSLATNNSAMAALQTLRTIGGSLDKTQTQVSSGLRISTAADNASYWSIATTMKSDKGAVKAVSDDIGLAQSVVDTAYDAMGTVLNSFEQVRNLAITASQFPAPTLTYVNNSEGIGGVDPAYESSEQAQLDKEAQDYLDTARAALEGASFNGVNLIYNPKGAGAQVASTAVNTFVTGYANGVATTMDIPAKQTLVLNDNYGIFEAQPGVYDPEETMLDGSQVAYNDQSLEPLSVYFFNVGIHNPTTGNPEAYPVANSYPFREVETYAQRFGVDRTTAYDTFANLMDTVINGLTDKMSYLGTVQSALDIAAKSADDRADTITKGVGLLVDANMEQESAKLGALQTQQQLAVQSLSIANSAPQTILGLFQQR